MAYITNAQYKIMERMFVEASNNSNFDAAILNDFSDLMDTIKSDKIKLNERTKIALSEKRKDPEEREKRREYGREYYRRKKQKEKNNE